MWVALLTVIFHDVWLKGAVSQESLRKLKICNRNQNLQEVCRNNNASVMKLKKEVISLCLLQELKL